MRSPTLTLTVALLLALPGAALLAPTASAAPTVTQVTLPMVDGTPIAATVFVPAGASASSPVPFVLMTHGWGGTRTSTPTGRVAEFLDAGYGVLTWDSRGFGQSGGQVMLNSPDFEVKDVRRLIDYVSQTQPVTKVNGDPVIGMSGGSYAGGIQLLSAAFDPRIDAIAPEITWNDLADSLGPNNVPKMAWIDLLFGAGAATSCQAGHVVSAAKVAHGCQTELLAQWYARVMATNTVPEDIRAELLHRSPATYMDDIVVPTLIIQGFPDTLFDVDQAIKNYEGIKANGAPVKLWLYDGGHILPWESGASAAQGALIGGVVVDWFDCHLKAIDCDTGPEVEWFDSTGVQHNATSWPPADLPVNAKNVFETLILPGEAGQDGRGMADLATVTVPTLMTGGVHLDVTVFSDDPIILFAAVGVRDGPSGRVTRIAQQNEPIRIDGTLLTNEVSVDLVPVSPVLQPGQTLVVTFQSFDPDFNNERTPGVGLVTRASATWRMAALE